MYKTLFYSSHFSLISEFILRKLNNNYHNWKFLETKKNMILQIYLILCLFVFSISCPILNSENPT